MGTPVEIARGVRVTLPDGVTIRGGGGANARRGPVGRQPNVIPMPKSTVGTAEADAVRAAIEAQEMELVGEIPCEAEPSVLRATRSAGGGRADVAVDVELGPAEGAAVLVRQGDYYSWHFGVEDAGATSAAMPRTRGGGGAAVRRIGFRIPVGEAEGGARTRGWVRDRIVGAAQVLVFKFAGRFLLGQAASYLERKVRTGLVVMDGDDPTKWQDVADFAALQLPADRPARILLFVHGTFSSTRGGFGGLCATPWGRELLRAARGRYDAVVGFDHATLSVDPLVNATALLQSLATRAWGAGASVDAVAHSRGGIVLRSLIEQLLPSASLGVRVDRAIFVGAVNGGTKLAEPGNWRAMIDLYTNVAVGACRAIAMFPQATFGAVLTQEVLKSVGLLVKVLANEAVDGGAIPGLASMQPQGDFVRGLNERVPLRVSGTDARYYAITSEFDPTPALELSKELPRQMLMMLAGGVAGDLFQSANDLVVNTDSMTRVNPQSGAFVRDTLAFGVNGVVYHTNYFLQPRVSQAMARWLDLETEGVVTVAPARRSGFRGIRTLEIPVRLNTDVLVAGAEELGDDAARRVRQRVPAYVVVERPHQGHMLHYAFRADEVLEMVGRRPNVPLMEALDLHETDASATGEYETGLPRAAGGNRLSAFRVIGTSQGSIVGVAESEAGPQTVEDLVREAEAVSQAPALSEGWMKLRHVMPTIAIKGVSVPESKVSPAPEVGRRRVTRGGARGGMAPPAATAQAEKEATSGDEPSELTTCHLMGEMDDEVVVGERTTVDVTLSREVVQALRGVSGSAVARVSADRPMAIEVLPLLNFVSEGETRVDVEMPEAGVPLQFTFDVKGSDAGEGKIQVRLRQGMAILAKVTLQCRIVAARTKGPARRAQGAEVMGAPGVQHPKHQLTINEIERGGKHLYLFTLDSPTLGLRHQFESKPLDGDRGAYIKGVYDDIETCYLGSKGDEKEFQKQLREMGGGLWSELFPEKLQELLWKHRAAIDSIMVFSEEPFIPWELVHLKEPGKGLGPETLFLGQMGLVRWLHNVGWPPEKLRARRGRCFYVIPKYPHPDFELPEAQAESDFLEKKLGAKAVSPHAGPVRDVLEAGGTFDLLHFACHGVAETADIARSELMLEGRVDPVGYVKEPLRVSVIENLTTLVGPEGVQPIVTLNACQLGRSGHRLTSIGGFSRAFLSKGAGMFIGAMWSVGDAAARVFTETMYERLLAGETVSDAARAAREAARQGEATWLAYTVYGNPNGRLDAGP